ncbi:hypothetical protein [Corynebacterium alimapuense]|nr:hypothetical protein [Corynebacterium alimapuense]
MSSEIFETLTGAIETVAIFVHETFESAQTWGSSAVTSVWDAATSSN